MSKPHEVRVVGEVVGFREGSYIQAGPLVITHSFKDLELYIENPYWGSKPPPGADADAAKAITKIFSVGCQIPLNLLNWIPDDDWPLTYLACLSHGLHERIRMSPELVDALVTEGTVRISDG